MKIKTTKKLNLPELIQYVIDKGWNSYQVTSDNKVDVYFSYSNNFVICDNSSISLDDTFTVEVCEELTKHYEFPKILEITDKNSSIENLNMSIHGAISPVSSEFYIMKDGKLHLIWTREHGIPESGVLEVDDE